VSQGLIPGSSAVEQATVNRLAGGSNPSRGATFQKKSLFLFTFSGDQTNLDALLEPLSAAFYNSKILCQSFTWCFLKLRRNQMTRTLLAAIFLTLCSRTAWAKVGYCEVSKWQEHNCKEGDTLRFQTTDPQNSLLEVVAWRFCNLGQELILTERQPVKGANWKNLVCVFQDKTQRPK
jgi:hypothetical protein